MGSRWPLPPPADGKVLRVQGLSGVSFSVPTLTCYARQLPIFCCIVRRRGVSTLNMYQGGAGTAEDGVQNFNMDVWTSKKYFPVVLPPRPCEGDISS